MPSRLIRTAWLALLLLLPAWQTGRSAAPFIPSPPAKGEKGRGGPAFPLEKGVDLPPRESKPVGQWVKQLQTGDLRARREAVAALADLGARAEEAIPALVKALEGRHNIGLGRGSDSYNSSRMPTPASASRRRRPWARSAARPGPPCRTWNGPSMIALPAWRWSRPVPWSASGEAPTRRSGERPSDEEEAEAAETALARIRGSTKSAE